MQVDAGQRLREHVRTDKVSPEALIKASEDQYRGLNK